VARFLTGVPDHWYHEIRLKTSDAASLVSFLRSFGASVHVTGPSGSIGESNTAPATDPRLVNLFLRGATGALPPAYLAEALTEATNSVQVVALGLGILVAAMVASALYAILARGFAERREAIGILRSMGAGRRWIEARLLRESLPYTAAAIVSGIVGGAAFVSLAGPLLGLRLFGHEFPVAIDWFFLASLALIVVAFTAASLLGLADHVFLDRPIEAIRDTTEVAPPRSLEVVLRD
jgi:FtsX-like permease family